MKSTTSLEQSGKASLAGLAFLATVIVLGILITLLTLDHSKKATGGSKANLVVFCAAGIREPVEAVALQYQKAYDVQVRLQYGGSQTLLAGMEIASQADVFIPGDDSYIQLARKKSLVAESIPVAEMTVILAVRKGNPKKIQNLDDLLRSDVNLAQANPDAAAVGKLARAALQKAGRWEAIQKKTLVFKPTVNDVANDLKLGAVDAGFIWNALLTQYRDLEAVAVPELKGAVSTVAVGITSKTRQPAAALKFARYLAARDRGQQVFAKNGYHPVLGDPWAETPEMLLFAGAMLRPAIEDSIAQFEKREGAKVTRVYNGCGILVAQMRTKERPDAYFSCDKSFMSQVGDLFYSPEDISQNPMIILAQKGNPKGIKSIKDLGAPGLRIGLAHEQQSALGALTKRMLLAHALYEDIVKNKKVDSATGDFLVNQLRAGSLDAVIVYVSNSAMVRNEVEVIPIELPEAFAVQPIAVGKQARYPQLAHRLHVWLRTAESQKKFETLGFGWQLGESNRSDLPSLK